MKKYFPYFLIIMQLLTYGQWIQTAGPQSTRIKSFYSTDSNTFYAGSFGDGVFKTTNKGATWHSMNNGFSDQGDFYCWSFTSSGNILFAGTQRGVFKTDINGGNWIAANYGIENRLIYSLLSYNNSGTDYLFAATADGVYKSTNNGGNWSLTGVSQFSKALAYKSQNGNSIFAPTWYEGIFRSDDNGENWINISAGLPVSDMYVEDVIVIGDKIFLATYPNGVYLSSDNGTSWTQLNDGLPYSSTGAIFTSAYTYLNNTIYVGTDRGVYKTTNYGDNWSTANFNNCDSEIVKIYANASTILTATMTAVFASYDESNSWTSVSSGFPYLTVYCMTAKSGRLFTGITDMGVYYTNDSGNTWYPANPDGGIRAYSLGFKDDILFEGTRGGYIYRSSDYGITWEKTPNFFGRIITTIVSNNQYLFIGTRNNHSAPHGSVLRSTDYGDTWINTTTGMFDEPVVCLGINNTNIFAGTGKGIYRSANNGDNWVISNNGLTNVTVKSIALSDTIIFAGTAGGVFKSIDNGITWTSLNAGLGTDTNITALIFTTNRDRLFAATKKSIYVTTLTGTMFAKTDAGLDTSDIYSLGTDSLHLYAGLLNNGIWRYSLEEIQVSTSQEQTGVPDKFELKQNYPNPFNPSTNIGYDIARTSHVVLKVYDLLGREVETLVNEVQNAGKYNLTWNAGKYSSGIYLLQMTAGDYRGIEKIVLLK